MSAPAIPTSFDLNAETYPFSAVEQELDRAAIFNLYCVPERGNSHSALNSSGREFRFSRSCRRFLIATQNPSASGLTAWSGAGEILATSAQRWVMIDHNEIGRPGESPADPIRFDPSKPQRFLMVESTFSFGTGLGGFSGFGSGTTFPEMRDAEHIPVCAVGTIVRGHGPFQGLRGTYTLVGTLSAGEGFTGNVLLRVVDPRSRLRARTPLPPFTPVIPGEAGVAWLVLRGQKKNSSQKTIPTIDPAGNITGFDVHQQLRLFDFDCALTVSDLGCRMRLRQAIGNMTSKVVFNLAHPAGSGEDSAPIPFTAYNTYEIGLEGGSIGSFDADGQEGRTFSLRLDGLPRQTALRFGGFGRLCAGKGSFSGIRGLMTDNSVVGLAPHALTTLYVLRIEDREGRYTSSENSVWW